jgi:acylphosphatase
VASVPVPFFNRLFCTVGYWNSQRWQAVRRLAGNGPVTRAMAARKNEQTAERREAYFSGHVQGVGFRYTVRQLASAFPVFGFVRNLADGRVHVVAEGSPQALDQFFAAISQRMSGHIRETTIDARPAIGEFDDFEIRH